jgi:hypothetical protein
MQDRLMKHGFVPHAIQHGTEKLKEFVVFLRHDLKLNEISDWHDTSAT